MIFHLHQTKKRGAHARKQIALLLLLGAGHATAETNINCYADSPEVSYASVWFTTDLVFTRSLISKAVMASSNMTKGCLLEEEQTTKSESTVRVFDCKDNLKVAVEVSKKRIELSIGNQTNAPLSKDQKAPINKLIKTWRDHQLCEDCSVTTQFDLSFFPTQFR